MSAPSTLEINKIRACLLSAVLLAAGAASSCAFLSDPGAKGERKPCCDPRVAPDGACQRSLGYASVSHTYELICACGVQDAEPGWSCATRLEVAGIDQPAGTSGVGGSSDAMTTGPSTGPSTGAPATDLPH